MRDPFKIEGPARISFSGGRTSAYMLWRILQAHGGTLPDDVHVCFANTGKEREETLRFVHECATRWNVRVRWLEWRKGKPGFEEVGYNSAARQGEPFSALIAGKSALPNWQARWCTQYLKVRPMLAFMKSLGHEFHLEIIGLRYDEGHRCLRARERAIQDGQQVRLPLENAEITQPMVRAFWRDQPFDLGLEPGEGNCDLCFMKGAKLRAALIRQRPELARWWIDAEAATGGFFDRRTRYATLAHDVARSPDLFMGDSDPDDEHDAECGAWCGA